MQCRTVHEVIPLRFERDHKVHMTAVIEREALDIRNSTDGSNSKYCIEEDVGNQHTLN